MKMRLLLIFVLTFTLSTQTDNTDKADAESMDNDNKDNDNKDCDNKDNDGTETKTDNPGMMEKVVTAFGEGGLLHLFENLPANVMEKLMECMSKTCTMEDLKDEIPYVVKCMKTFENGKPLCKLIKAFVTEGPMAKVLNKIKDEDIIKIIDCLKSHEINILMNLDKGPPNLMKLAPIGLKIVPILLTIEGGSELIAMFMSGGNKMGGGGGGDGRNAGQSNRKRGKSDGDEGGQQSGQFGGLGGLGGLTNIFRSGQSGGLGGLGGLTNILGMGGGGGGAGGGRSAGPSNRKRGKSDGDEGGQQMGGRGGGRRNDRRSNRQKVGGGAGGGRNNRRPNRKRDEENSRK